MSVLILVSLCRGILISRKFNDAMLSVFFTPFSIVKFIDGLSSFHACCLDKFGSKSSGKAIKSSSM